MLILYAALYSNFSICHGREKIEYGNYFGGLYQSLFRTFCANKKINTLPKLNSGHFSKIIRIKNMTRSNY